MMGNIQRTTLGPIPDTQTIVNHGENTFPKFTNQKSNPEPLRCSELSSRANALQPGFGFFLSSTPSSYAKTDFSFLGERTVNPPRLSKASGVILRNSYHAAVRHIVFVLYKAMPQWRDRQSSENHDPGRRPPDVKRLPSPMDICNTKDFFRNIPRKLTVTPRQKNLTKTLGVFFWQNGYLGYATVGLRSEMYYSSQERQPNWILNDAKNLSPDQSRNSVDRPVFIDTSSSAHHSQAYSPSDVYEDMQMDFTGNDVAHAGQKRVSAFQRLGPQTQPKTPKITINLNLEHEQPVREVVDETDVYDDDKYSPVHLRPNVINSTDETVMKYLIHWPWKKEVHRKKSVGPRSSKSAMLLELEKMEECYDRENAYIMVEARSYPASWTKENVLDAILESIKDKSFIPCFIDFTKRKCTFLVMRSKPALVQIHKQGFVVQKDDVELRLFISNIHLSLNHIDFIPRLVLRKRITMGYDGESKLDLKEFTLKEDISHFIYFPLNRIINQTEIIELKSTVAWKNLTHLDLSYNRLTSISGFSLATVTPKLKHLDLSHNLLNRITLLLCCRDLPLNSISLEGNPLCLDYIDDGHYIKVIRMMFPTVNVIDGEKVHITGKMPTFKKHYCRHDVKAIVDKFLEVFFPLLDSDEEQRSNMENLYDTRAVMTVTYNHKLRCKPVYRCFRNMFMWARVIEEGNFDSLEGASAIMKLVNKWPAIQHDPSTFNVDVMYHTDTTTIVRICGVLKLTAKTLADDEYLLAFTRTIVLKTENEAEYKIRHDMVYWDEPTKEYVKEAFQINTISTLQLTLKLDSVPDKDLQEKLLKIFMKVTNMDRRASLRCLEEKNWHFKEALEYYTKLLKMDSLSTIMKT
ncbi:hypothetical protein K1T71_008142 [Dendrolimus kikuchii]|uniref:Uncharacterized protein n=1 Tax=Dendrolimus kikuchii TaxID=765133 RepID=A0ACC1CWD9_9NEOP|nr:hypothetical protein K1T71_008142 [Dendrolimus kikuchii]